MQGYIYTIYDVVADEYAPLFTAVNDQVAARAFRKLLSEVTDKQDFVLRCLGYFDLEGIDPHDSWNMVTHILLEEPREIVLNALTGQIESSGGSLKVAADDVIESI